MVKKNVRGWNVNIGTETLRGETRKEASITHPDGVTVAVYTSLVDGKIVVQIDTSEYEDRYPSNSEGPTNIRVVMNDDFNNNLWDN